MLSIETNPALDRQLSTDRAVLLWRDREGGGREGLFIAIAACCFPWCPDRHVDLEAWWVDDRVVAVEQDLHGISLVYGNGSAEEPAEAFHGSFDVDRGAIEHVDRDADPAAVAWLERELRGELTPYLRAEFARVRARAEALAGARGEGLARAIILAARPRVGRNDPCPCGSGRKYKRCCLDARG